ncbi:DNA repair protein RecN [Clostridiaceae bacterium UIB06]|uniref:DNA repair protein RecN n=1 Tax=Clostridium thailandense TaxID=2794346 RepID=A0A949U0A5_9CLOT|nr:DNA repair protein RecN [Clostridium thailandense]MBV7275071.1 DNA repair protein RecN [Clostridium thailandense]MCH5136585.1 DNA repair protein RecN [Clostridiaceae bacterium UIB06]
MLLQLNIRNFALIESLTISFEKGFNVLSGETGAGKSILIDAINYVLGSKFSKDLIRTGENKTFVEAIFSLENSRTIEILKEQDIECDDLVIISRETFQSGKSIAKVNGKSILVSVLKIISSTLLDIHGQHENQNLLSSENHIHYLDYYGEEILKVLLDTYREKYYRLSDIENKICDLLGKDGEKEKLIDFFKYQIDEISSANLKENEEQDLEEKYKILSNAEKINNTLNSCYKHLHSGDENVLSIYDGLATVIREISALEEAFPRVKEIKSSLEEAYYNIEGSIDQIRSIKENVYYDEKELEYINSRIFQINSYKKKYGKTIKNILEYRDKIKLQYEEMINSNQIVEKLKKEKFKLIEELRIEGEKIHEERCRIAEKLEVKIKNELNFVGLEKSIFKVGVDLEDKFTLNGLDKVQFCISTNPGEPLKSLEKVVSGGELSRIMLALKTVFVDKDQIPSVIFDEIDTGISGRIAQCVAEKMYTISKNHQVFCVTHLPQIACISDMHYWVSKEVKDNKTYTKVRKMDEKEKEYEIARMIGGSEVTKLTLEHAKELIELANSKKNGIKV